MSSNAKRKTTTLLERKVVREVTSNLRRILNTRRKSADQKVSAIRVLFEAYRQVRS